MYPDQREGNDNRTKDTNMSNVIHVTDDNFRTEVLESSVPVLVDFFTEYCGPCKQLKPTLNELADELQGTAKIVAIDAVENPTISTEYSITVVPTLIVFKNGEITDRLIGLQSKETLTKVLSS